jgi:hypothetical protein
MLKKRPFEVLAMGKHPSEKAQTNAILTGKSGVS